MQSQLIFIFGFIIFGIVALLIFLTQRNKGNGVQELKESLKEIQEEIKESREKNIETLQTQLHESNKQSQESNKIVRDITSQFEKVHSGLQQVLDVKTNLEKLNDVLTNPKQRGILGEYFLETLLKNILPPNLYKLQYKFRDGQIVDAVIFTKDKIIPIDSKFSLENYNRIVGESSPAEREKLEKLFKQDLKARIDETAKYIRPEEGTMDFAFMFIPSEGIYYDLLINQVGAIKVNTRDLAEYARKEKHVSIVSPNTFYAYLGTILEGFRAFQIEESAKEIRKRVEDLQRHFLSYNSFMQKLGGHLGTTVSSYNLAYKEFGKIGKDVTKIAGGEKEVEPMELEKPNISEE